MTRQEAGVGDFSLTEDEKQQLLDTMNDMEEVQKEKAEAAKNKVSK